MTDEKTRLRVTSRMVEGIGLALEAQQVSTTHPAEARRMAHLALTALRRAKDEAEYLETMEERQISGIVCGPLAVRLRETFGFDLD